MATTASTTFSRMMKTLRENGNVKEKREVLTYITSQAKKLESNGIIKEEKYKELCRVVIEVISKYEGNIQNEALSALNAIVREFQAHSINLFEAMLPTDRRTRVKILKLLEVVDDNAISAASKDGQALNFFKDCMLSVQPNFMEWITPTACVDNIQMLIEVEQQQLSDEEKLEEDTISYSIILLHRLYKLAATTFDSHLNIQRFDTLLLDKIVTLAYMGHKRQRAPALKVLQQAVAINISLRICEDYPALWAKYKENLQSTYCKRMLLLVTVCDPDWTIQWNTTIQFLGTDLHRGASLINNLLSVEEKAFKSTDPIIRRQAFLSWKLLIDNFALDHQELATARRIKLLCIPLNAKNSKTELIALTKLEVWWHLIIKLYKDVAKFATPIITHFLNYCFGPLGDTPLLSSKFDVVASPGKRFFKTKVVAVDALYQLIVSKEDILTVCGPILEEKLPNSISDAVFQECSKSIIHSIGEALLILGQLTDQELKSRFQRGKQLWASLMTYIRDTTLKEKDHLYKDVILVVTELGNHINKPMVKDMIFDVILPHVNQLVKDAELHDNALPELVLKLLSFPMLEEVPKYLMNDTNDSIKCLLKRCISSEFTYSSGVFGFLKTIMENLEVNNQHRDMIVYLHLWTIIAEILIKNMQQSEAIKNEYQFKNVKPILAFPFQIATQKKLDQIQEQIPVWKTLYKQLVLQSDSIIKIKSNEILLNTADMMRDCLKTNKNCCSLIVNCFDTLLSTLDYESLLVRDEIPSILQLILDIITVSFHYIQNANAEAALKTLSALLITVFGHDLKKVVLYLHRCKSVIELMLTSQMKASVKEIISTWEYIISIFKGLNKHLDHELLSSYKQVIIMAMKHNNSDIRSLTQSIFEIKDGLDDSAKCVLDEIRKIEKPVSHSKSDSVAKKKAEESKEVRMAGSFLNRKSNTNLTLKSLPNDSSKKTVKKTLTLEPEPDSQDYVYIKTDLKFDVNRLTEHQKETLKKKREDIPALYNDLSQSSSQNSQNLQEWFDMKAKCINESDKANNKKNDSTPQPIDNDADKKRKNRQTDYSTSLGIIDHIYSKRLDDNVEENVVDTKQNKDSMEKIEKEGSKKKQDKKMDTSKQTDSTLASSSGQKAISETNEETAADEIKSIAKKLNFESREEFPENKTHERGLSPSMLDSNKRRQYYNRNSVTKLNLSLKSDETVENQKDSSANVQKILKVKITQEKSDTNDKEKKSVDDTEVKDNSNENKKGMKRKYVSDTESDGIMQRRKRKLVSEDGGETSRCGDVFSDIDMENVTKRTKNEISRLKIDMVFNCSSVNRRRVKYSDDEKETITHGLRKYGTPDNKHLKLKSMDAKFTEGPKKSSKLEKKDADDHTDQGILRRRGRRSTKQEANKSDSDVNKEVKKLDDTSDKISESKSSMDIDTTRAAPTSSQAIQDVTTDTVEDEKTADKDTSKSDTNVKTPELTEPSEQNQDDIEDFVESSQISTVSSKLDKKCTEKQCFIKINKMNVAVKTSDMTEIEKNYVPESIPVNSGDDNVPELCEQSTEANPNDNTEVSDEGDKDNVKDFVQETENSNTKVLVLEGQKVVDNTSAIKPTSVINFSPKSSSKVFSKPKSFTGRAAHMLGLVTKSHIEGDSSSVALEDESLVKKSKTKDAENETSTSKKNSTVEMDKIGGPSGSRQEKIFNNMRSHDYCALPSTFTTLKNDGEKLSFKSDKTLSDSSMEISVDKDNEQDASSVYEKDDLPMLEWSSANPPSLTASPSASILKRHRSNIPEPDLDLTPNKRKRVSFADPPVSKEMGYEISTTDSSKITKCSVTRGAMSRKDSSPKFKQSKLKFVSTDAEKVTTENEIEIDMEDTEAEKKSESLEKTLSELSLEAMIDVESGNAPEIDNKNNSHSEVTIIEEIEIMEEIVIATSNVSKDQLSTSKDPQNSVNTMLTDHVGTQNSETQQDIFNGIDTNNMNTSIQNSSVDSIKLNVTDDSVIAVLPTKDNSTSMEDTVDVQNITELNTTANTDDLFCGKLMRTSTHATENLAEQDTLPATDSIFSSLASQDTQKTQNNTEIEPEYLDSIQPIYPTLSSCVEPIDTIIEQLTYPIWKKNLCNYFGTRSINTIGELAKLSEREINRLPVKGKSKIEYVKNILQRFESTSMQQANPSSESMSNVTEVQKQLPAVENPPTVPFIPVSNMEMVSMTMNNTTLSCNKPLNLSTGNVFNNQSTENLDKTKSISDTDVSSESMYSGSFALPTLGTFKDTEQKGATILIAAQNTPSICTNNVIYMPASQFNQTFENIATVNEAPSSSGHVNTSLVPTATITSKFRRILPRPYLNECGSEIILSPLKTYIKRREEPVVKRDEPIVKRDEPVVKRDEPVVKRDEPVVKRDEPAVKRDQSVVKQDEPVVKRDEPVIKRDEPVIKRDESVVKRDEPVVQRDESIVKRDKSVITRDKLVSTRDEPVVKHNKPVIMRDKAVTTRNKTVTTRDEAIATHSSVSTNTESTSKRKITMSVESQITASDLLDEIDANLVLENAVRRCSPEALLSRYKTKLAHLNDTELVKETLRMLDVPCSHKFNELSLKSAARACGVSKVLLRLPDIFSSDKQFFEKVLNVYSKKLNINDCLNVFDFSKVKSAILQKCTSSELVEMLSEKLKEDQQEGITQPVPTLSSLDAMLQRLPMDVIISHTVANEELIPASVVLDIALQNNSSGDIAQALNQSPVLAKRVLDKLWTNQYTITNIDNDKVSKESLLNIFKSVCSKLTEQELLNAFHEAMSSKLIKNEKK